MTKDEVLKMALDALLGAVPCTSDQAMEQADAIVAIKEALAQPAQELTFTTGHCANKAQPGGCQLHNLQCGYPTCDRWPVIKPADRKPVVPNHDEVRDLVIELKTLIEDIERRLT